MSRSVVRYFGGKARLAPWILSHFPPHAGYVEPFGGGASVLLLKPPVRLEVYNDIDSGLVNLFRVLRDPDATARLVEAVEWTPYSKEEFAEALEPHQDPVESARRFLVRSWQSYAGRNATPTWGRVLDPGRLSERPRPRPRMWQGIPERIRAAAQRLREVYVECADARLTVERYARPETLIYLDPPYLHSSRKAHDSHFYAHEIDDAYHEDLAVLLRQTKAPILISHYDCPEYRDWYGGAGWTQVSTRALDASANVRRECLWINPTAAQRGVQIPLFAAEGCP